MTVRVRGVYATALTHLFRDDEGVVQASGPIRERFDEDCPVAQADAAVETTGDRQGVGVVGDPGTVERVARSLGDVARDAFAWPDPTPRGAVYAGEVTETLGSGAVVDLGDGEGFLPFSKTSRRLEAGDSVRVQVTEPAPPWADERPVLDATVRVQGSLATLVRGGTARTNGPVLADVLPTDPRSEPSPGDRPRASGSPPSSAGRSPAGLTGKYRCLAPIPPRARSLLARRHSCFAENSRLRVG